jgi:lipopolysaccharide/colanic/teichoic acid biosynthesis glycosyltransferase
MEYIDNWSLTLDFKILLRTIPRVLSGRGAS